MPVLINGKIVENSHILRKKLLSNTLPQPTITHWDQESHPLEKTPHCLAAEAVYLNTFTYIRANVPYLHLHKVGGGLAVYAYTSKGDRLAIMPTHQDHSVWERAFSYFKDTKHINLILIGGVTNNDQQYNALSLIETTLDCLFEYANKNKNIRLNIVSAQLLEKNTLDEMTLAHHATHWLYGKLNAFSMAHRGKPIQKQVNFQYPLLNFVKENPVNRKPIPIEVLENIFCLTMNNVSNIHIPLKTLPDIGVSSLDEYCEALADYVFTKPVYKIMEKYNCHSDPYLYSFSINCKTHTICPVFNFDYPSIPNFILRNAGSLDDMQNNLVRIRLYNATHGALSPDYRFTKNFLDFCKKYASDIESLYQTHLDYFIYVYVCPISSSTRYQKKVQLMADQLRKVLAEITHTIANDHEGFSIVNTIMMVLEAFRNNPRGFLPLFSMTDYHLLKLPPADECTNSPKTLLTNQHEEALYEFLCNNNKP